MVRIITSKVIKSPNRLLPDLKISKDINGWIIIGDNHVVISPDMKEEFLKVISEFTER